jgi:actin, other eukaryote
VAGGEVTGHLLKIFAERGYSFTTTAEREIVRDIKEKLCRVAVSPAEALLEAPEVPYELPDGQLIVAGNERFRAAEALFNPGLAKEEWIDEPGLTEAASILLKRCGSGAVGRRLQSHVMFDGGSTLLPGLGERIQRDLEFQSGYRVQVDSPLKPAAGERAWIGASLEAERFCHASHDNLWFTTSDYDEFGPDYVESVCAGGEARFKGGQFTKAARRS